MDFHYTEDFNLTEDVRDIERRFCTLYMKLIKLYFDLDPNFIWMSEENLFRLCIEDTSLALRNFYASLTDYVEIAKYLSRKYLKIYCVSGESVFSALGICTVIDQATKQYGVSHNSILKEKQKGNFENDSKEIQLIVTEKRQKWKCICSYIVEGVNSSYKNVKIKILFIDERSDRFSDEVFRIIKEADIVVMARYLSNFRHLTVRTRFLKDILRRMKELSILFYMDLSREIYYGPLKCLVSKMHTLFEIMSDETIYESLEDSKDREFHSEYPLLPKVGFQYIMFSTCIKCSGIKDISLGEKDITISTSPLNDSKIKIKLEISERFKRENLFPLNINATELNKNLTMSPKCFSSVSVTKTNQLKASKRNNVTKNPKTIPSVCISPSTANVETFSEKNETKFSKHCNGENVLQPSSPYVETSEKNNLNSEIFKASENSEKFTFTTTQSEHEYFDERNRPTAEFSKRDNVIEILAPIVLRNKYKHSQKEKKLHVESTETLASTNLQNKYKQLDEEQLCNIETAKTTEVVGKSAPTTLQNECFEKEKPKAEIVLKSKVIKNIILTNLHSNLNYSSEEKYPNVGFIRIRNGIKKETPTNLPNKCKHFGKVKGPTIKAVKTTKNVKKLAPTTLNNKCKYSDKETKPNAEIVKTTNKDTKKMPNASLQHKYKSSKQEKKHEAQTVRTSKIDKNLNSTNLPNKFRHSKEENKKLHTKITKTSKFVEKLNCSNPEHNCEYLGRQKKSNIKTNQIKKAIEKIFYGNQKRKYKFSVKQRQPLKRKTVRPSVVAEKLISGYPIKKNGYKSPQLTVEASVTIYSYYLSEIYYSKHFDKEKPGSSKIKAN